MNTHSSIAHSIQKMGGKPPNVHKLMNIYGTDVVYLHSGILFHSKKDQAAEYHVYFKVDETGSVERRQMQEMEN